MKGGSVALLAAAMAAACSFESTGPTVGDDITLRVAVSGGVLGVDYTFEVGDEGLVQGVRCGIGCDFLAGDTLLRLTPAQWNAVRDEVIASGLPTAGRPVDFGTECCDQFSYRVTYSSGSEVRSFTGSIDEFPEPLRILVRKLHLLYLETPPLVVSQSGGLDGFRRDALAISGVRVEDGTLVVDVSYAGGCAAHDVDAVAYTGWMESNPVQVGVALAHDAHGDLCKALIQRTLRFDLEPLRVAYAKAYGEGAATLVLRVEPAAGAPGGGARSVSFSF